MRDPWFDTCEVRPGTRIPDGEMWNCAHPVSDGHVVHQDRDGNRWWVTRFGEHLSLSAGGHIVAYQDPLASEGKGTRPPVTEDLRPSQSEIDSALSELINLTTCRCASRSRHDPWCYAAEVETIRKALDAVRRV